MCPQGYNYPTRSNRPVTHLTGAERFLTNWRKAGAKSDSDDGGWQHWIIITIAIPADIWTEEDNEGMSPGLFCGPHHPRKDAVGLPTPWPAAGFSDPPNSFPVTDRVTCSSSFSEFGRMPHDLAHRPHVCRVLPECEEHQRREGRFEHRQLFLDRISYPAALLVAVALGFEGALVALSASEAVKAKHGPPTALRVEMAKPPQCSIETPDQLFFL
jgi:hypothetical protein